MSEHTELDWQVVSLTAVSQSVRYGYTASASTDEIGPKFLRITDIVPQCISWHSVPYCEGNERALEKYLLQAGDIVVARTGATVGYAKQIRTPENAVFASYLVRFRINSEIAEPRFIGHLVESNVYKQYVKSQVGGAAQPNANAKVLGRFSFTLPPWRVQRRIADILSAYDDLIDNNRRRIALLEQAARELYREWFVRLRFPGHKNTRIADGLPEGWERKTLREVAITNAQSYHAKELAERLNYIDISSVSAGSILERQSMVAADAPGLARRKAGHGDVIWSNVRPNLKAYSLVMDPEENDVVSTGFTVLSPTKIPFTFLYQSVTSDYFVTYLVNHTTGASYPAVRPDDFERAEIVVPPPLLLTKFHEICESNYYLIAKLARKDEQLMRARDLLLPRLMSGEVAV